MKYLSILILSLGATCGWAQIQVTGDSPVESGETHTYYYNDDVVLAEPTWTATLGSITASGYTGGGYYATIFFNVGAGTCTVTFKDGTTTLGSLEVEVLAPPPPVPNATFTPQYNCGTTTINRTGGVQPGANYQWFWQTSASGESTALGYQTSHQITSTSPLWLRARMMSAPYVWSTTSQSVGTITVYTTAPSAPTVANNSSRFGPGELTVSVGAVSGALSYVWYEQSSGGTPISGQTTNSRTGSFNSSQPFFVASKNGCESSGRMPVTATILAHPQIIATGTNGSSITMGQNVTLGTSSAYTAYSWKDAANQEVGSDATVSVSAAGDYTVSVTLPGAVNNGLSNPFSVTTGLSGLNMNFVTTHVPQIGSVIDPGTLVGLPVESNTQSVQYVDGLGRPIQTVTAQGSPGKKDMVQLVAYDELGREAVKYLPYVAAGTNGWYKFNAMASQLQFYSGTAKIANDEAPFAKTIFEAMPGAKVLEQGSPGLAWQPDGTDAYTSSDRTLKSDEETNGAAEALLWTLTPPDATYIFGKVNAGTSASPVYYEATQLLMKKTRDEQQNEVIEYHDKAGRVVLKRVQASGSHVVSDTNYAGTYYIYDYMGNLVCVIPPEATKRLPTEYFQSGATDGSKEAFLKRWAFRYAYDNRRRMTHKQVPGAEPVYMVYDLRDRLIATQDGNQRVSGSIQYWSFTKYDNLNRPILTGIKDTTASLTQAQMQEVVNEHFEDSGAAWGETMVQVTDPNIHGYSNLAYPKESDPHKYLTVTYYDTYAFKSFWHENYDYADENLSETANGVTYEQPDSFSSRVIGQVTGSKVKLLDGGVTGGYTWLKSVSYYDEKYRVVQTINDNYKGGTDKSTSVYDFTGKVLKTKLTHTENDITWKDLSGATVAGNKLIRTAPSANSGGASKQVLAASTDGWMEFTVTEVTTNKRVGFNDSNPDTSPNNINYSFNLTGTTLTAMENSLTRQTVSGGAKPGDVLKIARIGSAIKWYRNGEDLFVTGYNASNGSQLLVDCTISSAGGTTAGVKSSFSTSTQTVTRRFVYDHGGRLVKTFHKLNTEDEVLLAQNEYNEIGQLVDKKLHSVNNGAFKQSTDMRYNIRGWLTSINNSQLAPNTSNDDSDSHRDLFGMELGYESSIGTENAGLYNGNISAMKWSRNLALGVVKNVAYNYTYDAMNRILSATYKKDTVGGWLNSNNSFSESGYSYDLNGNILGLLRRDAAGAQMDYLVYDYGSGSTYSNKLLKVTDSGDDDAGFKEINNTAEDYVYDANGNMVWDRNKGGEELLTNGGFENGSSGWQVNDAYSRFTFSGGNVTVAAGNSGQLSQNDKVIVNTPYVVIVDITRTSSIGTMTVQLGNHSTTVSTTGVYVLSMESTGGTPALKLLPGTTWAGTINSVSQRGLTVITYNFLNLPEVVTNSTEQMRYIYDATGRKLHQNVYTGTSTPKKATDYAGEFIYQNDTLQFINTEEGRVVMSATTPEYQYHLKDHLGNVRMTFTTTPEHEMDTATLEDAHLNQDASKFLRVSSARRVQAAIFDHTNGTSTGYSQRLNGSADEKFGLARSISVMPGDTVKAEVYAKYVDENSSNWTGALATLMGQIAANTSGVVYTGEAYSSSTSSFPFPNVQTTTDNETPPKAYLNWLVFDRNYNFISAKSGYLQLTTAAKEAGADVAHEHLSSPSIAITEPGYVYVYLSNEETTPFEVYFDDFKVRHTKSPVVQSDDYYPFGLAHSSYTRENSVAQDFKYNGKELQDELGLGWLDYGWRMQDPTIGRFMVVDNFAEKYYGYSPFVYAADNPTNVVDVAGDSLDVGGNVKTSLADIQSMVPKRYRDRISADGNGHVSFDTNGISEKKLRKGKLGFMNDLVNKSAEKMLYTATDKVPIDLATKIESTEFPDGTVLNLVKETKESTIPNSVDKVITTNSETLGDRGDFVDGGVWSTNNYSNSNIQLPQKGYKGQSSVNPNYNGGGVNPVRSSIVQHAVREMYFQAVERLPHGPAHRKAGYGGEVEADKIK